MARQAANGGAVENPAVPITLTTTVTNGTLTVTTGYLDSRGEASTKTPPARR
jgi:hypothetical protein